jgi:pimeloyl-ACP methyl ester carboxylesterase
MLRTTRKYPWSCAKFTVTGNPADLYGGTLAGARDVLFAPSTPESLVAESMARLQPDSTRAILADMIALNLVKTARVTAPLLVLGGEHDAIYPPSVVRKTAKAYGTQAMIFAGIGHSGSVEPTWATLAGHIASWLTDRGL